MCPEAKYVTGYRVQPKFYPMAHSQIVLVAHVETLTAHLSMIDADKNQSWNHCSCQSNHTTLARTSIWLHELVLLSKIKLVKSCFQWAVTYLLPPWLGRIRRSYFDNFSFKMLVTSLPVRERTLIAGATKIKRMRKKLEMILGMAKLFLSLPQMELVNFESWCLLK